VRRAIANLGKRFAQYVVVDGAGHGTVFAYHPEISDCASWHG